MGLFRYTYFCLLDKLNLVCSVSLWLFCFSPTLAANGRLCDERIYEEVFVCRDKCLFEKTLTKCTEMPAYNIANVMRIYFFCPPTNSNNGRNIFFCATVYKSVNTGRTVLYLFFFCVIVYKSADTGCALSVINYLNNCPKMKSANIGRKGF